MTLLSVQGFEGFESGGDRTALESNFNFDDFIGTSQAGVEAGRTGGLAAFVNEDINPGNVAYGLRMPVAGLSSEDDWIVGFAFYVDHPWYEVTSGNRTTILQFLDSEGQPFISIYPAAGTLNVRRGSPITGTKLGFADALLTTEVWHYLECKAKFSVASGAVTLRVNEEEVFSVSGVDTSAPTSGDLRPSMIVFGGSGFSQKVIVDDMYVSDDTGSQHNDFLGDNVAERLTPSGNGTTSQFVGSDADSTDNYLLVDDTFSDDDTTYVQSNTAAEKDTYAFGNLSATPAAIEAVSVKSNIRKSDAGSRTFVHVARSGGTELDSAVLYPSFTYRFMESVFPQDPNTAVAWTEAGVNAMEAGYKVSA